MIRFRSVAMRFGAETLFQGAELSLEPGDFQFLTGPSGAGKTTLLRLAAGDLAASDGEVELFGEPRQGLSRDRLAVLRRRIGVVPQDPVFLDHLRLDENILLPLWAAGQVPDATRLADLDALLAWVGLEARRNAFPPTLSTGERQRAALARAVLLSPDIILADEPTGNIDPEMSERLLSLLTALNGMGKAVLIATHDRALIRAAAQTREVRVLRLAHGQLERAGVTV